MRQAHPYEEIAFDIYEVEQGPPSVGLHSGLGYGFYGDFPEPKSFSELAQHVKATFQVSGFWASEFRPKQVKRIGFVAGKGASFVSAARAVGCDLFITGEAGYHTMLDGGKSGIGVIELGHRESEWFFLKTAAEWLKKMGSGDFKVEMLNIPTQSWIS
jgi:putative NIF3 family GTP cyclohydrolase 1 type 2